MTVRAKFQVQSIKETMWNRQSREVVLSPVCDDGIPEHQRYAKYTPSGMVTIVIDNPLAVAQFELGKYYYVDFNKVE